MSNDNKTLADVQPGGRVRLGDQAERARFEQCRGGDFERDAHGYYTNLRTSQDWAMWQAALSAQPSPGGQGDAPFAWSERAKSDALEAGQYAFTEADGNDLGYTACIEACVDAICLVLETPEHRVALAARQPVGDQHPDDLAVDAFAAAMKAKMAEARAKGRGGWEDPAQCTAEDLSRMLREHVEKGDPRDVANFCMMLNRRGEAIAARQPVGEPAIDYEDLLDQAKDLIHCGCSVNGAFDWLLEQLTDGEALTAPTAQAVDLGELRRAVCVVNVVGQIDGHDVVRRNSVLDVIDTRRQRLVDSQAVGNG